MEAIKRITRRYAAAFGLIRTERRACTSKAADGHRPQSPESGRRHLRAPHRTFPRRVPAVVALRAESRQNNESPSATGRGLGGCVRAACNRALCRTQVTLSRLGNGRQLAERLRRTGRLTRLGIALRFKAAHLGVEVPIVLARSERGERGVHGIAGLDLLLQIGDDVRPADAGLYDDRAVRGAGDRPSGSDYTRRVARWRSHF